MSRTRDHPRSRGEHTPSGPTAAIASGPSPLARGALCVFVGVEVDEGTIPARAGSTRWPISRGPSARDHPRSRGEHSSGRCRPPASTGPSPLARGARVRDLQGGPGLGTIPARAGSTTVKYNKKRLPRDHPRSRGEHVSAGPFAINHKGPSPLARGAHFGSRPGEQVAGTIPARAGSTAIICPTSPDLAGPSPLARGALGKRTEVDVLDRTIPARAGSTTSRGLVAGSDRDHPRSRGEHRQPRRCAEHPGGPSPLARGARYGTPL